MTRLPETRYSLLARLAEPADVAAWSEFVQLYERAIFRYSRSRGLQDADAWEVVQQVLILVHQKIGEWRPSGRPGAFRTWLLKTAHRVCLHAFRETVRVDRGVGETGIDGPIQQVVAAVDDDAAQDWERWAFCWAAGMVQREVEATTWRAFWLTAVEGLPAEAAAIRIGVKVGSIYTAKCRVLARIRELIGELSRSDP